MGPLHEVVTVCSVYSHLVVIRAVPRARIIDRHFSRAKTHCSSPPARAGLARSHVQVWVRCSCCESSLRFRADCPRDHSLPALHSSPRRPSPAQNTRYLREKHQFRVDSWSQFSLYRPCQRKQRHRPSHRMLRAPSAMRGPCIELFLQLPQEMRWTLSAMSSPACTRVRLCSVCLSAPAFLVSPAGGFKLWECSLDLVRYIHQHTELIPPGCSVMEVRGIVTCCLP